VKTGISRTPLRWLLPVVVLVLAVRQWMWTPTLISGESMQPTLRGGQLAWVNKLAYRSRPPQRGEIVIVRTPRGWIVKRILGLPGEEIAVRDGVFYIDGQPLDEPYVQFPGTDTTASGRLGPNRFLVAGDYRAGSMIAVVTRNRIVGGLVVWQKPPSRRG
jgi:signal peptidase I